MRYRILRVARSCWPLCAGFLLAFASLAVAPSAGAQGTSASRDHTLAVEDVLRLHQAGLSDDIIASEILVTGTVFRLSPEELIRLKEAGVSDALIHFMVETALDPADDGTAADTAEDADTDYEADGETYASASTEWRNEIALDTAPTYFVTLNYDYPDWYYASYWNDYWYWDYHFAPYAYTYNWYWGAWYPGWYSYRYCYLPSYWGYRSYCYAGWGYHWDYRHCDTYYASGAVWAPSSSHPHELSRVKYKTNGSSGKTLYADLGLKVRDPQRSVRAATRENHELLGDRRKSRIEVAKTDRIDADRVRRPVKSTKLTLHGERPATGGTPVLVDRRTPSVLDKPRVTTTRRPALDKPPTPRPRSVEATKVEKDRTPVRTPTPTVEKPRDRETPTRVKSHPVRTPTPPPAERPREEKKVKVKTPPPPKEPPRTEQPRRESPPPAPPAQVTPQPAPTREKQAAPPRSAPEKRTKTRGRPR